MPCCLAVSLGKLNYVHRGCSQFQDTPCSSRNDLDSSVPECISDSSQNAFHEHSKVVRKALLAFWHFIHWTFAKQEAGQSPIVVYLRVA